MNPSTVIYAYLFLRRFDQRMWHFDPFDFWMHWLRPLLDEELTKELEKKRVFNAALKALKEDEKADGEIWHSFWHGTYFVLFFTQLKLPFPPEDMGQADQLALNLGINNP